MSYRARPRQTNNEVSLGCPANDARSNNHASSWSRFVNYALKQIRMLLYFGVQPYLVFDGDHLPSKAETEQERYQRRKESKERGLALYHAGRTSQAYSELQKAIDVTPQMARQLIDELKHMKIPYVVAPYEADAQLAYLERKGIIDGVLSEDSDLLVFGVKRLLTKLDPYGSCIEINRADFAACRDISLIGWTDTNFRCMAILSGCDYLPNISKVGLKTAYRYVRKYKNIERILRMLSFDGQFSVPLDYLEKFKKAEIAFVHHRVFCPIAQKLVFLNDLRPEVEEGNFPFLGPDVVAEVAIGVACGDLHPMNKQPFNAESARFPRGLVPRRVTMGSTQELKAQRPLDGWIKPKRVPLAELDPNSLNYSPRQIRMIEANANASWQAMSVSSAPQLRRSTSVLPDQRGTPIPPRTERKSFLSRAATVSTSDRTPKSSKRQRLCTDVGSGSSPVALKVSPFFGQGETSPTLRKKSRAKTRKESEFNIFSDDSVEEAMMELRDLDEAATMGDGQIQVSEPQNMLPSASNESVETVQHANAQENNVKLPSAGPFDSTASTEHTNRTQSEAEKIEIGRAALHARSSNSPTRHRITYSTPRKDCGRLRAFKSMQALSFKPSKDLAPNTQNATCIAGADGYESDSPVVRKSAQLSVTLCHGSEDLLVPNSEDESEEIFEVEESAKHANLNLGKFMFTPT